MVLGGGAAPEPRRQAVFETGGGLLGLAVVSVAILLAVSEPPPWLAIGKDAYFIALSGAFFAGVAQMSASVWMVAGRKKKLVVYAFIVALLIATAGLALLAPLLR